LLVVDARHAAGGFVNQEHHPIRETASGVWITSEFVSGFESTRASFSSHPVSVTLQRIGLPKLSAIARDVVDMQRHLQCLNSCVSYSHELGHNA